LNANTPFFNRTLALAILCSRYLVILPVLAIAGSLAARSVCRFRPEHCPSVVYNLSF
jgi:potassium-transporting ATPase potassium-binding subunit